MFRCGDPYFYGVAVYAQNRQFNLILDDDGLPFLRDSTSMLTPILSISH